MNDADDALRLVSEFVNTNVHSVAIIGARVVVLTKFLDAVLPYLTVSQRIEVTESFRHGINDTLSVMDDFSLPPEYQASLLDLTNGILNALRR
jgi:hypothetical protein